ncbi:hypothetical protein Leryth_025091 [Lithospermum erythrorhizon]|nr:hypothetical protein Leryth_025091 [Lithospermum erythrorhizon]
MSRYLIVRNVPSLGCGDELFKLFSTYGDVEECDLCDLMGVMAKNKKKTKEEICPIVTKSASTSSHPIHISNSNVPKVPLVNSVISNYKYTGLTIVR